MISEQELEALIAQGREQRAVEFKGPGRCTDRAFVAKVARACIAISNLRDGGLIVIGVEDSTSLRPVGLSQEESATWSSYDDVASALARYCDPPINFSHQLVQVHGADLVVLEVREFSEIPTLAAKDSPEGTLQKGSIYVRGMSRIESTNHFSNHELRAVIDLAVEKGVRRFVEIAQRSGMLASATNQVESDAQKFDEQLGELA
jgi:predicted HTH transcriptional regulator